MDTRRNQHATAGLALLVWPPINAPDGKIQGAIHHHNDARFRIPLSRGHLSEGRRMNRYLRGQVAEAERMRITAKHSGEELPENAKTEDGVLVAGLLPLLQYRA